MVGMGGEKYKLSCKITCKNREGKKNARKEEVQLTARWKWDRMQRPKGQVGLNSDGN
jgi:hypothetical protein